MSPTVKTFNRKTPFSVGWSCFVVTVNYRIQQVSVKILFIFSGNEEKTQQSSRKVGLVLVGLTGGAAIGLSIIAAPFVAPALRKV